MRENERIEKLENITLAIEDQNRLLKQQNELLIRLIDAIKWLK